jgi:hypothetical protein
MDTLSLNVAGKNIEELTTFELKAIAAEAGREAFENAKKRGARVTGLQEGQLVWIYPDGHTEPIRDE